MPELATKIVDVYDDDIQSGELDIDHALYSGGFLNDEDRRWCERVIEAQPDDLATLSEKHSTKGSESSYFEYRARNYPNTLTADEMTV